MFRIPHSSVRHGTPKSRHRHQFSLWVQHNCFCMLLYASWSLLTNTRPSHWKRLNLDSSLQSTIDQSTQAQSASAIVNCNLYCGGLPFNRGFIKAPCTTRPASLSLLRTVLFDAWVPFCIHPILTGGAVSLLFCSDCLTSSLSSLYVDILAFEHLYRILSSGVVELYSYYFSVK